MSPREDVRAESAGKRFAFALALGFAGFLLNKLDLRVVGDAGPGLLPGGAAVLVAFVWLGPGYGLVAGIVSLLETALSGSFGALAALTSLVQAAGGWALHRRTGSLPFSMAVYGLTAGWAVDFLAYRLGLGLPLPFVTLLAVLDFLGGALSALVAEVALPLVIRGADREAPLAEHVFRRVMSTVTVPSLVLAFVVLDTGYQEKRDAILGNARAEAQEIALGLRAFLAPRERALFRLAKQLEADAAAGGAAPVDRLAGFLSGHPEILNVGRTDKDGDVIGRAPLVDAEGKPLAPSNLSGRGYFQAARASRETVYAPLILGTLHIRDSREKEPVLVIAEPLEDRAGEFQGILLAAVSARSVPPILQRFVTPGEVATLIDDTGQVVASLDREQEEGSRVTARYPAAFLSARSGAAVYRPAGSIGGVPGLDVRYAASATLRVPNWRIVVEAPASALHEAMTTALFKTVLFGLALVVSLYFIVLRSARAISGPLLALHETALAPSEGSDEVRAPQELLGSPIREIRDLAVRLDEMRSVVAERQRGADDELRASKERYRRLVEQIRAIVWRANGATLRFTFVSREAEEVLGYPARAWIDDPDFWSGHIHEEDREAAIAYCVAATSRREHHTFEYRMVAKDGRSVWLQDIVSVVPRPDGGVDLVGLMIDISQRKAAEEALRASEERQRQSQKLEAVGKLAGGIAHDFNNLMQVVIAYAEIARDRVPPGHVVRQDLEQISHAGSRAAELTAQLLAFSRREALATSVVDLSALVKETGSMLERIVGEDIDLRVEIASDRFRVRADATQLQQILMNLALNARDAMPGGGVLTIRLHEPEHPGGAPGSPQVGRRVHLTCADTGSGMDAETKGRIFEPFFTTKAPGKGTGLGLSTVYGIVEQCGGEIRVESAPGQGTTFDISIALVEEGPPSAEVTSVAVVRSGTETILVVEDEALVADLVRRILEGLGYRVFVEPTGDGALAWLEANEGRLDLLVTDVVLPRMSGPVLASEVARRRPGVPTLFVSGYDSAGGLGPDAVLLRKPFTAEGLARAVRDLLDRSRPGPSPTRSTG